MIKVIVKNNVNENEIIVDENSSIKDVLDNEGVDYTTRMIALNGETIRIEDLTKSFKDFTLKEYNYLMAMKRLDNASF